MKKYLEILGIWFWLTKEKIRSIYRQKAMDFHPDRNQRYKDYFERKMMELNGAYEYIMENFDDYINKVYSIKHTYIYFYDEWLYLFYVLKNYDLALKKFDKSIELNQDFLYSHFMKAKTLEKLWYEREALIIYQEIISRDNTFYNAFIRIWELLKKDWIENVKENRIERKVETFFDEAILNEWWYMVALKKGEELFKEGKYELALQMFDRAIEINPEFTNAYLQKTKLPFIASDSKKLLEIYDKLIVINPKNKEAYLLKKLDIWIIRSDSTKLLEIYEELIKINPNKQSYYFSKSELLGNLNMIKEKNEFIVKNERMFLNRKILLERAKLFYEANILLEDFDYKWSKSVYEKILLKNKYNIDANLWIIKCHIWLEKYEIALFEINAFIKFFIEGINQFDYTRTQIINYTVDIYNLKWVVWYKLWFQEEWIYYFDKALLLSKKVDDLYVRINDLYNNWEYNRCLYFLNDLYLSDKRNPNLYILMWKCYEGLQNYASALNSYKIAHTLDTNIKWLIEKILEIKAWTKNHYEKIYENKWIQTPPFVRSIY